MAFALARFTSRPPVVSGSQVCHLWQSQAHVCWDYVNSPDRNVGWILPFALAATSASTASISTGAKSICLLSARKRAIATKPCRTPWQPSSTSGAKPVCGIRPNPHRHRSPDKEETGIQRAKNLNDFDAVLFYTGGTLEMDAQQKADFISFVHDDGKGFIGIHSAAITFTNWPAYGEMIGGYYDEHPWGVFDAPILVEDAAFPGIGQWPKAFTLSDEIYQMKNYSRDNTRVLMRLDPSKLDLTNPKVHRKDNDFAVTQAKMYGKGRVFYSTLGHVEANWDRPEMQTMMIEAIKWATHLVDADVTPRPFPGARK